MAKQIRYVPVIGPQLRRLLFVVFTLFALLAVNSTYLISITALESATGNTYQDYFYQINFLLHLALGLLLVLPVLFFGFFHIRNAWPRPNKRAIAAGLGLYTTALSLLVSGIVLTRFDFFEIKDPAVRAIAYWVHVVSPLAIAWLFVLHRLAGKRIRWKIGLRWGAFAAALAGLMVVIYAQDPRQWNVQGPAEGAQYFFPSLARTATGNFIPARTLQMDRYCQDCHADVHESWSNSVHRFSSFNNPAYFASVKETREVALKRDGSVRASRFCAGCHDPVPFFSGAFDLPDFDMEKHPTANAGVTCTACHAITNLNSPRGNADYTIEEPAHYPFAFSDNTALRWINQQLVKAKPEFHKKTFLKPLHKSAEFCGTCHKVHLPKELNHYKWLRGQNHYDSFLLSGVSGHGVSSFYYPPKAVRNCAQCHMPLQASDDFGAQDFDASGTLKVHDHQFAAANTALPYLLGLPDKVIEAHRRYLDGALRIDLFALREGGGIDGPLFAPLRPTLPVLTPGKTYLLDVVIRTLRVGHLFTQGTADSNQIWLEVTASNDGRVLGASGKRDDEGNVDPWSHFVNAYVLDREGNRIDRRNAQDIFVALYNHQIPPGAADVIHYRFAVPENARGELTVEVALHYRKFDTTYMKFFQGERFKGNDLPIVTLARDRITLPVGTLAPAGAAAPDIVDWQRWNDYGIGLLRKGKQGELRQAEYAFQQVETLGRADGALNLARVYLREGRLDEAATALQRAAAAKPPAPPWTVTWLTGLVNKQNGFLDEAIGNFREILNTNFNDARKREFDFSLDYRVLNELGQTLFERAKLERGQGRRAPREDFLNQARSIFEKTLAIDPENVAAHYNLALIHGQLGNQGKATEHRALHAKYKRDDNAIERAVAIHRAANPAADHAAEAVVIYDLQRSADTDRQSAVSRSHRAGRRSPER